MASEKRYTPKEAAIEVLKKTEELLKKSEVLKKYASEMSSKIGYKPSKLGAEEKAQERDYDAFEVKPGKAKETDPRLAPQKSPSKNPKEEAEGNNEEYGVEPKDLGKKESLEKKYEGFKAVEESARKSGASDPAAVAAAAGRKKYGNKAFQEAAAHGKKMGKAENPDKNADAKLGEDVEHKVMDHMKENKDAETKEGHQCPFCSCMHKSEEMVSLCKDLKSVSGGFESMEKAEQKKSEPMAKDGNGQGQTLGAAIGYPGAAPTAPMGKEEPAGAAFIPAKIIGSAKLAKFVERVHAKRKARRGQNG